MSERLGSSLGSYIQRTGDMVNMSLAGDLVPVWGKITDKGLDSSPDYFFQWEEVYPDQRGDWQFFSEGENGIDANKSQTDGTTLLNPAVEINEGSIEIGSVVRMIPTELITDEAGNVHHAWLFSNPKSGLRPFKLTGTIIAAGGVGASVDGGAELELDHRATAEWLDEVGTAVTLYPSHKNEFDNDDDHLRLGIGRGGGAYMLATYGWAQFQANATAFTDPVTSKKKYQGEWQIVRLEAETIARVVLPTGTDIEPDERGLGNLWWRDADNEDFRLVDSTYQLEIYNDTNTTIKESQELNVWFDVDGYVWRPFKTVDSPTYCKVQTGGVDGGNGKATRTIDVRPCDWDGANEGGAGTNFDVETLEHPTQDTALFDGTVFEYTVLADGTFVSRGDIYDDPIGSVQMWNKALGDIRDGWRECGAGATADFSVDDGLFAKHPKDAGELLATGGEKDHGAFTNAHLDHTDIAIAAAIADHPEAEVASALANHAHTDNHNAQPGTDFDATSAVNKQYDPHSDHGHAPSGVGDDLEHNAAPGDNDLNHSATDNEPPWLGVYYIERFE